MRTEEDWCLTVVQQLLCRVMWLQRILRNALHGEAAECRGAGIQIPNLNPFSHLPLRHPVATKIATTNTVTTVKLTVAPYVQRPSREGILHALASQQG